jgi:hypothetical protein
LPGPTCDHPITAQRQRQSPRPRNPEHSTQVKTGHGDPPMTLTVEIRSLHVPTPDQVEAIRKPIEKIVSKFPPISPGLTRPFTPSIAWRSRIHHRLRIRLRHGWIALGHFDWRFKMTVVRGRFRPGGLGLKGADGLDTKFRGRLSRLGSP